MLDERGLAAELFRGVIGEEPPDVDESVWPVWARWEFVLHDQDGSDPRMYRINHDERLIDLYLHEGQRAVWDSEARFVFMMAGKQGGKTTLGPLVALREMQERGAGDYLAVSATFDLFKFKQLPALKQLFVHDLGIAKYRAGDRVLEMVNPYTGEFAPSASHPEKMWTRLTMRSGESEEGLQSATAKWAWEDEAGLYGATVHSDLRGRLSLHRGGVLATTSIYGENWLKLIYDRWKTGDEEIDVIQFASNVNPFFSQEEYESLRKSMQTWRFNMEFGGEFDKPPGLIYEDFGDYLADDPDYSDAAAGHLVRRFMIPTHWPRYVAIDPGVVNPGKCWFAHDVDEDVYYLYRAEKGGVRRTSKEHAIFDVERANKANERVILWAIGAKSEKYWRQDYYDAGARGVKEPSVSDVEEGLDRGTHLIKQHRLLVFEDLRDFRHEITHYSRQLDKNLQDITDKIKDKSTYHLMDAYRYFAVQVVKVKKEREQARTTSYVGRNR